MLLLKWHLNECFIKHLSTSSHVPLVMSHLMVRIEVQKARVSTGLLYLTAHNWQKWKRVFLTCPCHKIYRGEAVGLKSCKYTWKITIFVKMWNLGQYRKKIDIHLSVIAWLKLELKNLLHMRDTYNCDYLKHSTFHFNLINFQLNTDFCSQFCIFYHKSPSVTQRSVSQENACKKS